MSESFSFPVFYSNISLSPFTSLINYLISSVPFRVVYLFDFTGCSFIFVAALILTKIRPFKRRPSHLTF
jgi:hypothetical protein